jgi:hypothetical protein
MEEGGMGTAKALERLARNGPLRKIVSVKLPASFSKVSHGLSKTYCSKNQFL